jgi:hypothetical protein
MPEHRLVHAITQCTFYDFTPPFSSFSFIDNDYGGSTAIRRLFSLARSNGAQTLAIEKIPPVGIIASENAEIKKYYPDHHMPDLHRISFWRSAFQGAKTDVKSIDQFIGYAILKHDIVPSKIDLATDSYYDRWHVFEAVFEKFQHPHNCVPSPCSYSVLVDNTHLQIKGLLYAQQNGLNKACAQVALRSLISRIRPNDISYKEINDFASPLTSHFKPENGLNVRQMRTVLNGLNIPFRDMDYSQYKFRYFIERHFRFINKMRKTYPYQNYLYAGVESGTGALVGFRLTSDGGGKHIIPFYGHTFNKDTWAPDADLTYFRVGKNLEYISSQYWTSSFLGHDDNFGANYCVPRLYLEPSNVDYVVELLKPKFVIRGVQAEGLSLYLLHSVLNQIDTTSNIWLERLARYDQYSRIVLRAVAVEKSVYINHIKSIRDWEGHAEKADAIELFDKGLPDAFWVVEISLPQLFPANESKLGEVVIHGKKELDINDIHKHLLYVRLPGAYYMLSNTSTESSNNIYFKDFPSNFTSHVPVLKL